MTLFIICINLFFHCVQLYAVYVETELNRSQKQIGSGEHQTVMLTIVCITQTLITWCRTQKTIIYYTFLFVYLFLL